MYIIDGIYNIFKYTVLKKKIPISFKFVIYRNSAIEITKPQNHHRYSSDLVAMHIAHYIIYLFI